MIEFPDDPQFAYRAEFAGALRAAHASYRISQRLLALKLQRSSGPSVHRSTIGRAISGSTVPTRRVLEAMLLGLTNLDEMEADYLRALHGWAQEEARRDRLRLRADQPLIIPVAQQPESGPGRRRVGVGRRQLPDVGSIGSIEDLRQALIKLRHDAGNPPWHEMAARANQAALAVGSEITLWPSTLYNLIKPGRRRIRLLVLLAFVEACGVSDPESQDFWEDLLFRAEQLDRQAAAVERYERSRHKLPDLGRSYVEQPVPSAVA